MSQSEWGLVIYGWIILGAVVTAAGLCGPLEDSPPDPRDYRP